MYVISVEIDDDSCVQKVEMNDDSCVQKRQMDEEIIPSWLLDHIASLNDIKQDDDHEDDHKDDDDDDDDDDDAIKESTISHSTVSALLVPVEEDSSSGSCSHFFDRIDLHIDTTTITHDLDDLCIDTAFDSVTIKQYYPEYYFNDERGYPSPSPYSRSEKEKEEYSTYSSRSNHYMVRTFSNHDMVPSVESCCDQSSCMPPVTQSTTSTTNLSDLFEKYPNPNHNPSPHPPMLMIDTTAEEAPSVVTNTPTSDQHATTGQLLLSSSFSSSSSSSVSIPILTKEKIKAQSPLPLVRTPHYHSQLSPSCPPSKRRNATSYLM
jgi:hypothetical protein